MHIMGCCHKISFTWWRHQMETFSALLAFCAGNSPVSGEFPSQRPVARSFDVFFDLRLIKRLSKYSRGWGSETLSRPLWRHCNVVVLLWSIICFWSIHSINLPIFSMVASLALGQSYSCSSAIEVPLKITCKNQSVLNMILALWPRSLVDSPRKGPVMWCFSPASLNKLVSK